MVSSADKSFTTTILVTQTPKEVFDAINNVRKWWSESIEGITDRLDAEFLQYYRDIHIAKMKIVEFVEGKKLVWLVLDSHFSFTGISNEWKDTRMCFDISKKGDKTQLHFTHLGLVPKYECFNVCHDAWNDLIGISLHGLITSGRGRPNPIEDEAFNPRGLKRWRVFLPGRG